MKVGIVVYPGSNCDRDTLNYFTDARFIWHKSDKLLESIDLLVIPGGFAFGEISIRSKFSSFAASIAFLIGRIPKLSPVLLIT